MEKTILVVDDDAALRDNLADILNEEGYRPILAANCSEALALVRKRIPRVALIDLKLPDGPGTMLLSNLKRDYPGCICIMITAYADLDSALAAMEQGAFQYLQKPVRPLELLRLLDRAFDTIELRQDKQLAEQKLKESEERFRELAELLPETIYEMDVDGRLTFVNHRALEQFGYTQADLDRGLYGLEMLLPEDRQRAAEAIARVMTGQEGELNEYTALRKDRTVFPILIRSTPIIRQGKRIGIRGLIIDITEKKRLEAQFLQAQKMEAMGTLAGGIAHDFNNLMMGIQGRTSLMLMDLRADHPHYEHLVNIQDYVKSAAELTKQLLGFARGGKYQVKPVNLNKLVTESADLFGRTKKEIQIHRKLTEDIRVVEADQAQIRQVLLNLYLNAWQAMPGGGELILQTENISLTENDIESFDAKVKVGGYVKISITDTGSGMDEAIRRRIFDPFFTTKNMGRGTGLGLASAYGIIRSHGGFITVWSEQGKGSSFHIHLPVSDKELLPEAGRPAEIIEGRETVLLVDDEAMILDVGKKMLERLGYKVLVAHSGKKAIEIYTLNQKRIQLVILDLIMPEMNGRKVFERLKQINPKLKVLLASGYSLEGEAKDVMDKGCDGFIQKPFNMHDISQKLGKILARP